jgi:hypothetical protein
VPLKDMVNNHNRTGSSNTTEGGGGNRTRAWNFAVVVCSSWAFFHFDAPLVSPFFRSKVRVDCCQIPTFLEFALHDWIFKSPCASWGLHFGRWFQNLKFTSHDKILHLSPWSWLFGEKLKTS